MSSHSEHNGTILGTICGTLLSVFASVQAGDIIKTSILATVGAITSFTVSILCKIIVQKIKNIKPF